jgi:aspartyl-tRNA(Asn)/glutamyl-tRNA(Gln) amidotransferase subunit A
MTEELSSAGAIAAAVREGRTSATEVTEAALARITANNARLNAFTDVVAERARQTAGVMDAALARGEPAGRLAGVPFAVKNLFDVAGLPTRAGSRINRTRPPAAADAVLVRRLEAAGAVLVGALNMGEYAYDFTGENIHDGPSRNPLDPTRMTGGSSGGSAAAVAGGLVPIALGSDTNGSIRVPAALCGIFGLKPTYGRLPRTGTFPFVDSLDHLGPFARSVTDLTLAYDALQGHDAGDAACRETPFAPVTPMLENGPDKWRVGIAEGYFTSGASQPVREALERVAGALGAVRRIEIDNAQVARAGAYLITTIEAAALHLERLRGQPAQFEPIVRDRLLSGAMVPAHAVARAQKFRSKFRDQVLSLLDGLDAIIAPATPCTAPLLGQQMLDLDGRSVPLRANIGLYTQPISFVGLPVVAVPVPMTPLPAGIQIITAPWREDVALGIARTLERLGVTRSS